MISVLPAVRGPRRPVDSSAASRSASCLPACVSGPSKHAQFRFPQPRLHARARRVVCSGSGLRLRRFEKFCAQRAPMPRSSVSAMVLPALEGGGARRLWNESFFSAPQLKRDSLGSTCADQLSRSSASCCCSFSPEPSGFARGGAHAELVRMLCLGATARGLSIPSSIH
jgi:hypothetical protein